MNIKNLLKDPTLLKTNSFIAGEWLDSTNYFEVINPFDNQKIASVSDHSQAETQIAISKAEVAFKVWRNLTANERSKYLHKWHDLILENAEDLALILTLEQGKPLKESKGEIEYGAGFVEWFAEEGKRVYGDIIPSPQADKRILTLKQPIGVVAAITPWNFPIAMITRKVAPALAVGCTVVVKPAESTPLSALALAELSRRAGIPKGVFNVIIGSDPVPIGRELTSNPIVKKLSFTGSTATGKILARQCVDTVKKVSLELGGNAPFIIFEDADLKAAVQGVIVSKYRNAGQTCICANRIFVQKSLKTKFVNQLAKEVQKLKMGNGLEQETIIGPLINSEAVSFNTDLIRDAVEGGSTVVLGGKASSLGANFFEPTILTDVNNTMKIHNEEIFGPIAAIYTFETEAEVIAKANDTPYGLAAYFYTKDYARIWRLSEQLEYGMVGINTGFISTIVAPFGGVKASGYGREGSKYGVDDFLEIKYLSYGGLS